MKRGYRIEKIKKNSLFFFPILLYNKAMVVGTNFQEEKLQNILDPKSTNKKFKVSLRIRYHSSPQYRQAVELARKSKFFLEEGTGNAASVYVSFYPEDVDNLYTIFELVKDLGNTQIFLNDKNIPYIQELWLFLLWFYKVA